MSTESNTSWYSTFCLHRTNLGHEEFQHHKTTSGADLWGLRLYYHAMGMYMLVKIIEINGSRSCI